MKRSRGNTHPNEFSVEGKNWTASADFHQKNEQVSFRKMKQIAAM